MRLTTALVACLALSALAPPLAAAHFDHPPCGPGQTSSPTFRLVHIDRWRGFCVGVVVSAPEVVVCDGLDVHAANLHVLILYSDGCQTGVIGEFVSADDILP